MKRPLDSSSIDRISTKHSKTSIPTKFPASILSQVAIIIPVHNAAAYLSETLSSIASQTYDHHHISVHLCDDASTDTTPTLLQEWKLKLESVNIQCILSSTHTNNSSSPSSSSSSSSPPSSLPNTDTNTTRTDKDTATDIEITSAAATGAGNAKNIAVSTSTAPWLCFLDADDTMYPTRIFEQHKLAMTYNATDQTRLLIGSGFIRLPKESTTHYTHWCNNLTKKQLILQQYREVTVIQPTWFLHRDAFNAVGGYQIQQSQGTTTPIPSDLIFFQSHLDQNGLVDRVEKPLVIYRYLKGSVSWKIPRKDLLRIRLRALERRVLSNWTTFTIWGAGRDGKNVINELKEEYVKKCIGFCDIDPKKIKRGYYNHNKKLNLPVVHFSQVKPPLLICVAMGRTDGALEKNIESLGLIEGVDYWHVV